MDSFIITGGTPLAGEVAVRGAKNVALKVLVASLLTDEELIIHNVPILKDVTSMLEVLGHLGVTHEFDGNTVRVKNKNISNINVPLEAGSRLRTSAMVLGPLLARYHKAIIPNPGGCRLGARPIDRSVEALKQMGVDISYHSEDGFFHAKADKLRGTTITFPKNTHTGTETILLAAALAEETTIIHNAAAEVEVDALISLLNQMGARIRRTGPREIAVEGVRFLHGTEYSVMPDRNEEVTFAVAAAVTGGNIVIRSSQRMHLASFLAAFAKAGGVYEELGPDITAYRRETAFKATDITTGPHPGFMTDWQAPWALLMTQADGVSTIHETIFERRFSYVSELRKMGAAIEFFDPQVDNPEEFYNFNWSDRVQGYHQGIRIAGPTKLHNAVLSIDDLRAGATLVLAAIVAEGESYVSGAEQVDRGYEKIEERLRSLGAMITRVKEE